MRSWVMFGEIISLVGCARAPETVTLPLMYLIAQTIKEHVQCFGPFLFDSVISNSTGIVVVSFEWGSQLWVAQLFQGSADGAKGLGIEE